LPSRWCGIDPAHESAIPAGGSRRRVRRAALLSKFTAVMLNSGRVAFMLVPDWRRRLAAKPLSMARGVDRGGFVPAGFDLERPHGLGVVQIQLVRATAPMSYRCAPSPILSACSSGWLGSPAAGVLSAWP